MTLFHSGSAEQCQVPGGQSLEFDLSDLITDPMDVVPSSGVRALSRVAGLYHYPQQLSKQLLDVLSCLIPDLDQMPCFSLFQSQVLKGESVESSLLADMAERIYLHRLAFQETQGVHLPPEPHQAEAYLFVEELAFRQSRLVKMMAQRGWSAQLLGGFVQAATMISMAQFALGREQTFPETLLHGEEVVKYGMAQVPRHVAHDVQVEMALCFWGHDCKIDQTPDNLITHPILSALIVEGAMVLCGLTPSEVVRGVTYNLDSGFIAHLMCFNFVGRGSLGVGQVAARQGHYFKRLVERLDAGETPTEAEKNNVYRMSALFLEIAERVHDQAKVEPASEFDPNVLVAECRQLVYQLASNEIQELPLWFLEILEVAQFHSGLVDLMGQPIYFPAKYVVTGTQGFKTWEAQLFVRILGLTDALSLRTTKIYDHPINQNWAKTFQSYIEQSILGNYQVLPADIKPLYLECVVMQLSGLIHALHHHGFIHVQESDLVWMRMFIGQEGHEPPLAMISLFGHWLGTPETWVHQVDTYDEIARVLSLTYDQLNEQIFLCRMATPPHFSKIISKNHPAKHDAMDTEALSWSSALMGVVHQLVQDLKQWSS